MPAATLTAFEPRKTPVQARSTFTVEAISEATIQVLLSHGADRLTTSRVAARAGVSVGTLYQYYPNKRSLLFAVFMTNPAPICVLDEVDAPLDDINVERFCGLVKEISERTDTRFLIITHHRVTMPRMDRLYGVTMAEQGVSQLVSVNLQEADRMVA